MREYINFHIFFFLACLGNLCSYSVSLSSFFFFFKIFYTLDKISTPWHIKRSEIFRYHIEFLIRNNFVSELFLGNAETQHFPFILTNNFKYRSWDVSACLESHCLWGILCWRFHRVIAGPVSVLSPSCFILRILLISSWPKQTAVSCQQNLVNCLPLEDIQSTNRQPVESL